MAFKNEKLVFEYCDDIISGKRPANIYQVKGIERFRRDLKNKKYDFNPRDAEWVIGFIETLTVHKQGERLDGSPLLGEPFLLEPFHKYTIYALLGFYHKGTNIRRYTEAFIYWPRKNIKTSFAAAFSLAMGFLERKSGSKIYIVAGVLKQALESYDFMENSIASWGQEELDLFRIRSYNGQYSIERKFTDGSMFIQALASNPDKQDSLNMNMAIADEIHTYKSPKQYNVIKEGMKAYTNKLMIGITTAGDNMNSFAYNRLVYCKKILDQTVVDDAYFVFIAEADEIDGFVDYTNAKVHAQANPAYGISIRPEDIMADAMQAMNDPQQRKDFLAKSLNVYTSSIKSYFDLNEFRISDDLYNWGYEDPVIIRDYESINYEELAALDIEWFGGVDLSRRHDLTAGALTGKYEIDELDAHGKKKKVTIMITHAWYPRTRAQTLGDVLQIPYMGWEDSGWLSFVNGDVIEYDDLLRWFVEMREEGFNIVEIGYDRSLAKDFIKSLEAEDFETRDIAQKYWVKNQGFREIERQMKRKQFYYLHSEAFEYNVENVKATEDINDQVRYEKTDENQKIDMFDAGVMATVTLLENENDDTPDISNWFA